MSEKAGLILYLAFFLAVSFLWQGVILLLGGIEGPYFTLLASILMYFPAIGAVIYLLATRQGLRWMGFSPGRKRYLLYAVVIPIAISFLIIWTAMVTGLGTQQIFVLEDGMVNTPFIPGGPVPFGTFLAQAVIGGLFGILVTCIFTFGEELGWRGFLQNKLVRQFGFYPAILLLGLYWGIWHAPIIYDGYNFPGYPLLGALVLMPLLALGFSGVLAWLTIRAGSLWPAVLAHATINSFAGRLVYLPGFEVEPLTRYLLFAGFWVVAGALCVLHLGMDRDAWNLYLPGKET